MEREIELITKEYEEKMKKKKAKDKKSKEKEDEKKKEEDEAKEAEKEKNDKVPSQGGLEVGQPPLTTPSRSRLSPAKNRHQQSMIFLGSTPFTSKCFLPYVIRTTMASQCL